MFFSGTSPVVLQFIAGGALVGFIVGATGVGGGSLMTPLLTLVFGVPAQVAVGTDLLFASITKAGGSLFNARQGRIPWHIVGGLALGSVPASIATIAAVDAWHPDARQFAALVKPALAGALLLTAGALLFRAQIVAAGQRLAGGGGRLAGASATGSVALGGDTSLRPLATVVLGSVLGVVVTLTSVGAGAIGVVALLFLYPALPARQLVAADIAHAVPLTLVAGLGHAALGTIHWTMLGALLVGSLPAIWLGSAVAGRLPERALRLGLAAMLVLIGVRLLLD